MNFSSVIHGLCDHFCLKNSKLKWTGSLEDLKVFILTEVDEETDKSTGWKSPSGGTWTFVSYVLSVTWHKKSENIFFKERNSDDLTELIYSYIKKSKNVAETVGFVEVILDKSTDATTGSRNNTEQAEICSCNCTCSTFWELEGIKLDMTILETRVCDVISQNESGSEMEINLLRSRQKELESVVRK